MDENWVLLPVSAYPEFRSALTHALSPHLLVSTQEIDIKRNTGCLDTMDYTTVVLSPALMSWLSSPPLAESPHRLPLFITPTVSRLRLIVDSFPSLLSRFPF